MNATTRKRRMMSYTGSILAVVLGGLVVFFAADRSPAQGQGAVQQGKAGEQMLFQTPDAAMKVLLKALKNDDDQAMIGIFGPQSPLSGAVSPHRFAARVRILSCDLSPLLLPHIARPTPFQR